MVCENCRDDDMECEFCVEVEKPYWNGKTSDHPMIQKMIQGDNEKFHVGINKFDEVEQDGKASS